MPLDSFSASNPSTVAQQHKSVWVRLSGQLPHDLGSACDAVPLLLAHAAFAASATVMALHADGMRLSWLALFTPLLGMLLLLLVHCTHQLLRQLSTLEERSVFLRAMLIFWLLICLAAGALAALVANGVNVTGTLDVLRELPPIDATRGLFLSRWSTTSNGSASLYIPVTVDVGLNTGASALRLDDWVGLNVSEDDLLPVYDPALFDHVCMATTSTSTSTSTSSDGASTKVAPCTDSDGLPACAMSGSASQRQGWRQTCQVGAQGEAGGSSETQECLLYVEPHGLLDRRGEQYAARLVRDALAGGSLACGSQCPYARDGVCDDSGPGSSVDVCAFGSDCADCGERSWHDYAAQTTSSFPRCGWHSDSPMPQRWLASWAAQRRHTCRRRCTTRETSQCPAEGPCWHAGHPLRRYYLQPQDEQGLKTAWCCDELDKSMEGGVAPVVAEALGTAASAAACARQCLAQHYSDQAACSLLQFAPSSGACERVEVRGRLCSREAQGLHCESLGSTTSPLPAPRSASSTALELAPRDPYDGLALWPRVAAQPPGGGAPALAAPAAPTGGWTPDEAWNVYALGAHAWAGQAPAALQVNAQAQVVLAPFICVPLLLGLLIICVCCTPLNCLPDVRITDEDVCAWDYALFRGPAYLHAQVHNFRLLLAAFAISVWQLLLFFAKTNAASTTHALPWAATLAPLWTIGFFVLLSAGCLLRRVKVVLANSVSGQRFSQVGLHLGAPKGRFLVRALAHLICLWLPAFVALAVLCVRLDVPRMRFGLVWVTVPLWAGLGLHVLLIVALIALQLRLRLHLAKHSRLESLELVVQADRRHEQARELAQLKEAFLSPDSAGEDLVHLLELIVRKGRRFTVTYDEIKVLGHQKLVLLEDAGTWEEVWTPQVAKHFGTVLRDLLDRRGEASRAAAQVRRRQAQDHLQLADLGYTELWGTLALFLRPAAVRARITAVLDAREAAAAAAASESEGESESASEAQAVHSDIDAPPAGTRASQGADGPDAVDEAAIIAVV